MSPIALLTDFGLGDVYVGVLKGVIQQIAPGTPVLDVSHAVPRGDVRRGAFMLRQTLPYFPDDTVFLAVVDPGVGTPRRPLVVTAARGRFVGPDNGLFTYALLGNPVLQIRALTDPQYRRPEVSATFHGRDIFAPAAAHLAMGVAVEALGPPVPDPVQLPLPWLEAAPGVLRGEVLHADRFGNLVTSIGVLEWNGEACTFEAWIPGRGSGIEVNARQAQVRVGDSDPLPLRRTFADAPPGGLLSLINSDGHLEIAANGASAADRLKAAPGTPVTLEWPAGNPPTG